MEQHTIKDIARICGVSVSTVSRVINDHPDVSKKMRERVLAAIQEHNYIPNDSARNLVKTTSDTIALVVRGISNPFFSCIIKGVEQEIYKHGYTLILHQISTNDDEIMTAAMIAKEKRLRGIIFLGGRFNYSSEDIALLKIPFVFCTYTNTFGELKPSLYSSVAIDDKKAAYDAVKHLVAMGHKRIAALVVSTEDKSISELRFSGYVQALEDCGIPLDMSIVQSTGSYNMADGYTGMEALINAKQEFTAVFTIADALAIAAIKGLHDHGMVVPQECSVISIDGIELSNYIIPTLTTLEQPAEKIASESIRILIELIEEKGENQNILLGTTLREGASIKNINE